LPGDITKKKKQGFSAPDESWYRGENFEYVKDNLLSNELKMEKYISRKFVSKVINEHMSGVNHRLLIWSFLCFEEWCRQYGM